MSNKQRWHPRLVHADAHAVAGYARLGYFENRITDLVSVTNTDLVVRKSVNSKIFSKLAKTAIVAPKNAFPVSV
jgi:hypothetical protein